MATLGREIERSEKIMAKYNCSAIGRCMMMLKQDIKDALQGKVEGKAASKEECDNVILNTFDAAVFHVLDMATGSRAMERIMESHGCKLDAELLQEYMVTYEEEERKHNNYKYEGNKNDN